jgi:hypothetical protein
MHIVVSGDPFWKDFYRESKQNDKQYPCCKLFDKLLKQLN